MIFCVVRGKKKIGKKVQKYKKIIFFTPYKKNKFIVKKEKKNNLN